LHPPPASANTPQACNVPPPLSNLFLCPQPCCWLRRCSSVVSGGPLPVASRHCLQQISAPRRILPPLFKLILQVSDYPAPRFSWKLPVFRSSIVPPSQFSSLRALEDFFGLPEPLNFLPSYFPHLHRHSFRVVKTFSPPDAKNFFGILADTSLWFFLSSASRGETFFE